VLLPAFSAFTYTGRVVFVSGDWARKSYFHGKRFWDQTGATNASMAVFVGGLSQFLNFAVWFLAKIGHT